MQQAGLQRCGSDWQQVEMIGRYAANTRGQRTTPRSTRVKLRWTAIWSSSAWFQALMDDEDDADREILGLGHLKNQTVRALGDQPGDDQICNQLFQTLDGFYRAFVTAAPPEADVFYYGVGDRYLVDVVSDVTISLWSVVFSFDREFNELGSIR